MDIFSSYVAYNANEDNLNTRDCVARGISIAFGSSYNTTKYQLRKRGRQTESVWNNIFNFEAYIRETYGSQYKFIRSSKYGLPTNCTVEQFAREHPTGTYLLIVGKNDRSYEHMVAVIDGDWYDSWNSKSKIISNVMDVSNEARDISIESLNIDEVVNKVNDFIDSYISKLDDKYKYVYLMCDDHWVNVDETTSFIRVKCMYDFKDEQPSSSGLLESTKIYVKINPSLSFEENVTSVCKHIQYKLREFAYKYNKFYADREKERSLSEKVNPRFHGSRSLLMKLPKDMIPHMLWIYDNGYYHDGPPRYEAEVEHQEGDDRNDDCLVYADSWNELKYNIKMYLEKFERYGYDY